MPPNVTQDSCKGGPCNAQPCKFDPAQIPAPIVQCNHQYTPQILWTVNVVCHKPATTVLILEEKLPSIPPIGTKIPVFPVVHGYTNWRVTDIQVYVEMKRVILHVVGDDSNIGQITTDPTP